MMRSTTVEVPVSEVGPPVVVGGGSPAGTAIFAGELAPMAGGWGWAGAVGGEPAGGGR